MKGKRLLFPVALLPLLLAALAIPVASSAPQSQCRRARLECVRAFVCVTSSCPVVRNQSIR